jgi:hypothetical protein
VHVLSATTIDKDERSIVTGSCIKVYGSMQPDKSINAADRGVTQTRP